jgi:hypothetical protein
MRDWPQMFDAWPGTQRDAYGPFWRLETAGTAATLAALSTPHDRTFLAALLEVLPELATRGATAAALPAEEVAAWAARARGVVQAVAEARAAPR